VCEGFPDRRGDHQNAAGLVDTSRSSDLHAASCMDDDSPSPRHIAPATK